MVSGAAASQEQLASAAEASAGTIRLLTDHVKLGAAALTSDDQEAQVRYIHTLV